jgi:hypothetical protein
VHKEGNKEIVRARALGHKREKVAAPFCCRVSERGKINVWCQKVAKVSLYGLMLHPFCVQFRAAIPFFSPSLYCFIGSTRKKRGVEGRATFAVFLLRVH